jgi:hypothetical protein
MRFALVQLSDIHLVSMREKNPILDRQPQIAGAIRQASLGISHGFLVVSGDVAYSGKPEEYALARPFIDAILRDMKNHFGGNDVPLLLIPGNHDCDFQRDNDIRRLIIRNLDSVTDDYIVHCTEIQRPFYDFADSNRSLGLTAPLDRLRVTSTLIQFYANGTCVGNSFPYFPPAEFRDSITARSTHPWQTGASMLHRCNCLLPQLRQFARIPVKGLRRLFVDGWILSPGVLHPGFWISTSPPSPHQRSDDKDKDPKRTPGNNQDV